MDGDDDDDCLTLILCSMEGDDDDDDDERPLPSHSGHPMPGHHHKVAYTVHTLLAFIYLFVNGQEDISAGIVPGTFSLLPYQIYPFLPSPRLK
jgi:hypothetical protein